MCAAAPQIMSCDHYILSRCGGACVPRDTARVDKINPAEHLILADRLWIVQGGCNQILKIDVFDVKGVAHMRAACVLRDLLLVSHAIKARLHCIWCARDLTERESGGKDLDEDRLHHSRETAVAAWLHALSFINQPSLWPPRPTAPARATRLGPRWLAVPAAAAASGVR